MVFIPRSLHPAESANLLRLFTFVSYAVFFSQCYILANALGLAIDYVTITLFMAMSNLISFIPVSVSGLGTRDAILIYLFSLVGFEPELAVSYAFLVFVIFFVFGGIFGAIAWWIKPLPKYGLRNIELNRWCGSLKQSILSINRYPAVFRNSQ